MRGIVERTVFGGFSGKFGWKTNSLEVFESSKRATSEKFDNGFYRGKEMCYLDWNYNPYPKNFHYVLLRKNWTYSERENNFIYTKLSVIINLAAPAKV